ncbi:hypothetical protein MSG28_002313 [Choristoneura fumiferana]|uniref:Uncharacterized protein n=1 Tax=Choristoneura fumiferana TaxID=7141 RepID=A0ACC0JUX7_CHOFU|nr:hypothetical protein MSG28_002313 [Choristoneura fumiferana]
MTSNILKPDLIWIEGRCYRSNDPVAELNTYQESNLYENETIYHDEDEYEDCEDIEIVTHDDSRFSTSVHVSKHYIGSIIGKKGYTKSRIEHETKTEIKIPRQGQAGDVTIFGSSASNVRAARRRLDMIVMSSRMKQKPTHFISIPMINAEIISNFTRFQESILRDCPGRGLEESIFMRPKKLHLTLGVMCLMDNEERMLASKILTEAKEKVIMPLLQRHLPLKIRMKGLSYMNDDPRDINVLYAKVEECDSTPGILQQLADGIADYFYKEGLMNNEHGRQNVKLHVTLINSKYRNQPSNQDVRAEKNNTRESFDGSEILERFANFEFGVMELRDIHLSQRHALGPDGYYQPTFVLSCTM